MRHHVTVGADPEFFLARNGLPINAFGIVPGTKAKPVPVEGGAIQNDGTAAEYNIDPADTKEVFLHNLKRVESALLAIAEGEVFKKPTVDWGDDIKTFHPKAVELGCSPDYNAYTGLENPRPDENVTFRTAGGHIHIGGVGDGNHSMEDMSRLVRVMDREVGMYSLLWDTDHERRKLYGAAGAFRIRPYGVEYRTLSNAWTFSEDTKAFVYDGTLRAVEAWEKGKDGTVEALNAINNNDIDLVMKHGDPALIAQLV